MSLFTYKRKNSAAIYRNANGNDWYKIRRDAESGNKGRAGFQRFDHRGHIIFLKIFFFAVKIWIKISIFLVTISSFL